MVRISLILSFGLYKNMSASAIRVNPLPFEPWYMYVRKVSLLKASLLKEMICVIF